MSSHYEEKDRKKRKKERKKEGNSLYALTVSTPQGAYSSVGLLP